MIHFAVRLVLAALAILATVKIVPGVDFSGELQALVLLALLWALIVQVVKPILSILTLPISFITLGLFSLVLNVGLFYALTLVPGFSITNLWAAILGSFVLSLITSFLYKVF
jgi:putative membrane protein